MLPTLQRLIPGAGLTVFNVWDCPYDWWLGYVQIVQQMLEKVTA